MEEHICIGRECRLGWGYNESTGKLIPIDGEPLNVQSEVVNKWEYKVGSKPPLGMDIDIGECPLPKVCSLVTDGNPEKDGSSWSSKSSNEVRFSFVN